MQANLTTGISARPLAARAVGMTSRAAEWASAALARAKVRRENARSLAGLDARMLDDIGQGRVADEGMAGYAGRHAARAIAAQVMFTGRP